MASSEIFFKFTTLKNFFSIEDTPWEYSEEPHTSRRKEILKKHPEIKHLMGYDPSITYIVLIEIFIQLCMFWFVRDMAWGPLFIVSYVVSGTLNHSLGSAIHEIGHNLAYGHRHPLWNRALGMLCNLPMGVPLSVTYKKYHSDHHRYLGNPELDADVPTRIECFLFRYPLTRILWLIIHPVIHGIRPFMKQPYPPLKLEILNFVLQISFDAAILYFLGPKSLFYCVGGTLLGLGLHPLAGHFISEHYMFTEGQATVSYYGPLNPILFNVGYHVEHHDFPYIPWRRLPEVRRIAPEYYDNLPHHTSWLLVLWKFIFDSGMGPEGHGVGYLTSDLATMKKQEPKANGVSHNSGLTPKTPIIRGSMSNGHTNGHANGYANGHANGYANGKVNHADNPKARMRTRSQSKALDISNNNGTLYTDIITNDRS